MPEDRENSFGFVTPELMDLEPAEEELAVDPFAELDAPLEEVDEEYADEVYENLEDEYRVLASLKQARDRKKREHSEASADYEAHRGRMMRAMRGQGTKQFKSTTVEQGACHFSSAYGVKIVDPVAFLAWAKKKAEELLSVNAKTLTKHVREQFKQRGVPPDDPSFPPGLEVTERDTLTVNVPKETD